MENIYFFVLNDFGFEFKESLFKVVINIFRRSFKNLQNLLFIQMRWDAGDHDTCGSENIIFNLTKFAKPLKEFFKCAKHEGACFIHIIETPGKHELHFLDLGEY